MENSKVKINYLYNSSFKVETENHVLIFDYYNDLSDSEIKNSSNGTIGEDDINTSKKVVVFATHSHGDHFSEVIFKWKETRPDIKYMLSSDINNVAEYGEVQYISPYEQLETDDVQIMAFGSTDLGVSLLIRVDGINLFHAGDLNWWNWYDESDEYNSEMEKAFKAEIEKLKGNSIDIAFFPVDPRLKDSYVLGPDYFIDEILPKALVPMHFREDYYITKEYKSKKHSSNTEIFKISKRGEELVYQR
jgi:L-ascorbate metabolism protein UlaG (beta-lactamase superfamily)